MYDLDIEYKTYSPKILLKMILTRIFPSKGTYKNLDEQSRTISFPQRLFYKLKISVHIYEVLIFTGTGDEFSDCEVTHWDYIR